ncbi:metal ABC transporter solute-binding protein, Zn/Mn family [Campylobacter fetus]|uniref:metal ABC transporter solute-binding protein, Zn/Mn family n=1 Tax=Campylobacter fetus TaxID=196 RepID=UPI001CD0A996
MNKFLCVLCIGAAFIYAKPVVTTSILPTKYFVEQIAGDSVDVNYMVNAGADPHIYEPRPEQMKNLEKSDIFFAVGMEYENTWLPRFAKSYPSLDIIKTQKGVPLITSELMSMEITTMKNTITLNNIKIVITEFLMIMM